MQANILDFNSDISRNIVTTDVDFTRVNGINVYTCNPEVF